MCSYWIISSSPRVYRNLRMSVRSFLVSKQWDISDLRRIFLLSDRSCEEGANAKIPKIRGSQKSRKLPIRESLTPGKLKRIRYIGIGVAWYMALHTVKCHPCVYFKRTKGENRRNQNTSTWHIHGLATYVIKHATLRPLCVAERLHLRSDRPPTSNLRTLWTVTLSVGHHI